LKTLDTTTDSTSSDVSSSNNNSESTTSLGNGIIQQNNVQQGQPTQATQTLPDPRGSTPYGNPYPNTEAGN